MEKINRNGDKGNNPLKRTKSEKDLVDSYREWANMFGGKFEVRGKEDAFGHEAPKPQDHSHSSEKWAIVETYEKAKIIEDHEERGKELMEYALKYHLGPFKNEYEKIVMSDKYKLLEDFSQKAEMLVKNPNRDSEYIETFKKWYDVFTQHAKAELSREFSEIRQKLFDADDALGKVTSGAFEKDYSKVRGIKEGVQQLLRIVDGSRAWINNDLDVNNSKRREVGYMGGEIAKGKMGDRPYDYIFDPKDKPERTIQKVLDSMSKVKRPDEHTYAGLCQDAENIKSKLKTHHSHLKRDRNLFSDLKGEIGENPPAEDMLQKVENSSKLATPDKEQPLRCEIEDIIKTYWELEIEYGDFQEESKDFSERYEKFKENNKQLLEEYVPLLGKSRELEEVGNKISNQKESLAGIAEASKESSLEQTIDLLKIKIKYLRKDSDFLKARYKTALDSATELKEEEIQFKSDKKETDDKLSNFTKNEDKRTFVEEYRQISRDKEEIDEWSGKFNKNNEDLAERYKVFQEKRELLAEYADQFKDSIDKLVEQNVIHRNRSRLLSFGKMVKDYSNWLSELKFENLESVRDFVKSPQELRDKAVEVSTIFKGFPGDILRRTNVILNDIEDIINDDKVS